MRKILVGWLSFSQNFVENYIHKLPIFGCDTICLTDSSKQQLNCIILHSDQINKIKNKILLEFRKTHPNTPAIIMSNAASIGRAEMIKQGIDDAVSSNIHINELYERIVSLHHRYNNNKYLNPIGPYVINYLERIISFKDTEVPLKPREFLLFDYLLKQSPHIISRSELLSQLWKLRHEPGTNSVEVHIWRLRQTLKEYIPYAPTVRTIRGKGYTISIENRAEQTMSTAMV